MLYEKWLVNAQGERVPTHEAEAAFVEAQNDADNEAVLQLHGWTFVPIACLPTLGDAVGLLLARAAYRRLLNAGR